MSNKNTGKTYEENVRDIFQAIIDYDNPDWDYKKISVKHNVTLPGKSGTTHQIDVFWEFEIGGISYKTIVEVKDWKSPVKQEQIHSFYSVINDIEGCSKGIFVSKNGFQSGAITFAKTNGINLFQIDKNAPIKVWLDDITTNYTDVHFYIDEEWMNENDNRKEFLQHYYPDMDNDEIIVIHPLGQRLKLIDMIYEDAVPYYYSPAGERNKVSKILEGPWFFETKESVLPLVKILGYEFVCYNTEESYMIVLDNFCDYVIKDILGKAPTRYYKGVNYDQL